MSDIPKGDLEALRDLMQSPGWALFKQYAERTWQDEFDKRTLEAIGMKATTDLGALQTAMMRLQQAAAIREELRALFRWPKQQVDGLTRAVQQAELVAAAQSRRPSGL